MEDSSGVVPAGEVSDLLPFQPHPLSLSEVEGEQVNHCHITQEGVILLLSCGPRHHSYAVRTGHLKTTWRFGRRGPSDPVAGPSVYTSHGGRYYTVVALRGQDGAPHLLCVCHLESGKTLKAIRIPAAATHICLVDSGDREESLVDCPAGLMRGCIAVSTEDAEVFLVDLCLGQEKYSSEEYPAPLKFLEGAMPSGPAHGAIFVFNKEGFVENDPGTSSDQLEVTCLEYFPQLRCLAIGLSTGTVHLWSPLSGCPILALKKSPVPVVGLMLQEPENDPRRWCYLWVISGTKELQRPTSTVSCALFSLDFSKKTPLDRYRSLFEGLSSCHQVFECSFGPKMAAVGPVTEQRTTSRLISCRTMLQAEVFGTNTDRQHDLNLMLLSWELLQGSQSLGTYLTIFDMNQWYQAQMPSVYRCQNSHLSSYLAVFSLKEAAHVHGSSKVLDVHVVPRSVTKFHPAPTTADQYHFPSALACKCICVTERGIVHVTFLGLQRQLFQNLDHWGPRCLLDPKELYLRCCRLGLLNPELPKASLDHFVPSMQKALLGMAVDNRLKGFLLACVKHWPQNEGSPGLAFLLNSTWERVKEDKMAVDSICVPLFDCIGHGLSEDKLQRLVFIGNDLKVLHWLFRHCTRLALPEIDPDEMELRCEVVERIEEYVAVLLFLINCGLLPEVAEGSSRVAYPGTFLTEWYQRARESSPLLIDSIMEAVLGAATPPWGSPYPAPTMQEALTGSFLMHSLPAWGPRVLMLYILLDLASASLEPQPEVVEGLKAFPVMFKMSNSLQWFVQGCWNLDHSFYEKGLDLLLQAWSESCLGFSSLFECLKRPILRLLSARDRPKMALRFISRVPFPASHTDPELLSLHLGVLLADRRVSEALSLVRRSGRSADMKDFLEKVVSMSKPEFGTSTLLRKLLEYPLSQEEESMLEGMLQRSGDSKELAVLALHWLRAGRTQDAQRVAVALRDSLKRTSARQVSGGNPMYAAVLALVQNFADLVPSIPRSLGTFRRVATKEVHLPSPMRVLPKKISSDEGQSSRLHFAVGSLTVKMRKGTPYRKQNLLQQTTLLSECGNEAVPPPCKTPKIAKGTCRKSNVTPTVLADALAVLHTPPVKRLDFSQHIHLPQTPPPSILKSRALFSCAAPEGGESSSNSARSSPPPTPLLLPDRPCSTPDVTNRKLRFADPSPSEVNSPVECLDVSSVRDMSLLDGSRASCSEGEVSYKEQSRFFSVTVDEESSHSATELGDSDAPYLSTSTAYLSTSHEESAKTIDECLLTELDNEAALTTAKRESSPLSFVHGGVGGLPEKAESTPEVAVKRIFTQMMLQKGSKGKALIEESASVNVVVTDLDLEQVSSLGREAGTASVDETETPLAEEPDVPTYIPGLPTNQDVFEVLHSATVVPVEDRNYNMLSSSSSLDKDYLLMTSVDPNSLLPIQSVAQDQSPETDKPASDDDSDGTPLKESEASERNLFAEGEKHVKKILFESDTGSVASQFVLEEVQVQEVVQEVVIEGQYISTASEKADSADGHEEHTVFCQDKVQSKVADKESPVKPHSVESAAPMGTVLLDVEQRPVEATVEYEDSRQTVRATEEVESGHVPSREERIFIRCKSEEPSTHTTIVTRLRTRRCSETSEDSNSGQGLMFKMGSGSESSMSLLGSEPGDVSEGDENTSIGKVMARRRSARLLDMSSRQTLKLDEKPESAKKSDCGLSSNEPHGHQLRSRRASESTVDHSGRPKETGAESEVPKQKKMVRSPSRKSLSQQHLGGIVITVDEVTPVNERGQSTPRRSGRARSEEPVSVTMGSMKKKERSLADSSELEQVETTESSKRRGHVGRTTRHPTLDVQKAIQDPTLGTVSEEPKVSNDHSVQDERCRTSTSKIPSNKPKKTSAEEPSGQKTKGKEEEKEGRRRTPKKKEVELAQHKLTTAEVVEADKQEAPPSDIRSKGRRSTAPGSPARRRMTPRKKDSPVPSAASRLQQGTSSMDIRALQVIPEDSVPEDVAETTTRTPSKTSKKEEERSGIRRRSMRLLETIPEGRTASSGDAEEDPSLLNFERNRSTPDEESASGRQKGPVALGAEQWENMDDDHQPSKDSTLRRANVKKAATGKAAADSSKHGPAKKSLSKTPKTSSETLQEISSDLSPEKGSPSVGTGKRSSPRVSPEGRAIKRRSEESLAKDETFLEASREAEEAKSKSPQKSRKGRRSGVTPKSRKKQPVEPAEDTFQLSAPAYLSDKSVVVPPEAESKIFIFSPPLTRHRSSLLSEDVFKRPKPEEAKSAAIRLVAPIVSPPPAKLEQERLSKRRRSSAAITSTKLVNTIKRRSVRVPATPQRATALSKASAHDSPGSPWTVVKPKKREES